MRRVSGRIGIVLAAVLGLTVLVPTAEATTSHSLSGVRSIASGDAGSCALLTSGTVDCWGYGHFGQLGNGNFYSPSVSGGQGSAVPVAVTGVGGTGTLTGVASLISANYSFCALLTSGEVDCWGNGADGELGNGTFYTGIQAGSAFPVAVKGVGGTGTLTGVASLTGANRSFCALLTSGEVDCWGNGADGELGNGTFYTGIQAGSAFPVAVTGVGGTGTLTGVASLTGAGENFCARLTSGELDCWGQGSKGQLGNGSFYTGANFGSAIPVAVKGVGGTGTLTGVTSLAGFNGGSCARLTSGKVDCWGQGSSGQLGNGSFSTGANFGSAIPVAVKGVGGTGTLTGVTSLAGFNGGSCARLTSGKVDCWGQGSSGQLGNGRIDSSALPVAVKGLGGSGTITGVVNLTSAQYGSCARLTSGRVDCWGESNWGTLGDGSFGYSAVPVAVKGVGGSGTLTGVVSLTSNGPGNVMSALLASGGLDCWGQDYNGQLGNGTFRTTGGPGTNTDGSAVPVEVLAQSSAVASPT
jgi:alpha-tubulin suppressor-like RCC1 family protein